jgi:hypothetical protein
VKYLNLKSVPGEKSEILSSTLVLVIKKHELQNKVIGLCTNNFNKDFTSVQRRGEDKCVQSAEKEFHRELDGVGCAAHNTAVYKEQLMSCSLILKFSVVKIHKCFNK